MAFARLRVLCVISDASPGGRFDAADGVFSLRAPAAAPEPSAAMLRVRFRPELAGSGDGDAAKLLKR